MRERRHTIAEKREMRLASNVTGRDRLFTVRYDASKLLEMRGKAERYQRHEVRGTHYANGLVTLHTGVIFDYMGQLHEHFEVAGWYELIYDDESEQA